MENDLTRFELRIAPEGAMGELLKLKEGSVTLVKAEGPKKIKIWADSTRKNAPASLTWDFSKNQSPPEALWVEGVKKSGSLKLKFPKKQHFFSTTGLFKLDFFCFCRYTICFYILSTTRRLKKWRSS